MKLREENSATRWWELRSRSFSSLFLVFHFSRCLTRTRPLTQTHTHCSLCCSSLQADELAEDGWNFLAVVTTETSTSISQLRKRRQHIKLFLEWDVALDLKLLPWSDGESRRPAFGFYFYTTASRGSRSPSTLYPSPEANVALHAGHSCHQN